MQNWQKAALITFVTLTVGGIYLFSVFWQRRNPGVVPNNDAAQHETPDDVAIVRMMFMTSFDDALKLAAMLNQLYAMPKLTVACVQGAAMGGGMGLACCCDVVSA